MPFKQQNRKLPMIPMMIPKMHSHCLGHGPVLTPEKHKENLIIDKMMGYGATVLVPALIDPSTHIKRYVDVHRQLGMDCLVCGFHPGDGADPLHPDQRQEAAKTILRCAEIVSEFAEAGLGQNTIVGPIHTLHRKKRPVWNIDEFQRWMDHLDRISTNFGDMALAMEPLNHVEDGTPAPFDLIAEIASMRPNFFIHYDTGHAHMRGKRAGFVMQNLDQIRYFEFANVGRSPLHMDRGINFQAYFNLIASLPHACLIGDEPFDPETIEAFDLGSLCDTKVPGREALWLDASFFRGNGLMKAL